MIDATSGPLSASGRIEGSCVTVRFQDVDGDEIATYDYSGHAGSRRITGNFTGHGPHGCESEGSIEVTIDPLPPE